MILAKSSIKIAHSTRPKAAEVDVLGISALNHDKTTVSRTAAKIHIIPVQEILFVKASNLVPIFSMLVIRNDPSTQSTLKAFSSDGP